MYTNFLGKKMVMYKIDRRGGGRGGVQKSFSRTDPTIIVFNFFKKRM